MGLIGALLNLLFGDGRNAVRETAEVFRENAEAGAAREADLRARTLAAFAAEFAPRRRGGFDRFMDGINRLPRPALALGTLALFVAAMVDPVWFAERMTGIALVPEPLWWLLAVVVSFYFGARHQAKGQDFQRELAATLARLPEVARGLDTIEAIRRARGGAAGADAEAAPGPADRAAFIDNPALADWQKSRAAQGRRRQ